MTFRSFRHSKYSVASTLLAWLVQPSHKVESEEDQPTITEETIPGPDQPNAEPKRTGDREESRL